MAELSMGALDVARRLACRRGFVWLDGDGSERGRYSYLSCEPAALVRMPFGAKRPLDAIADLDTVPGRTLPCWIGYVAYDAAWSGGSARREATMGRSDQPVLWFGRYDAIVRIDHQTNRTELVGSGESADRLEELLRQPPPRYAATMGTVQATPRDRHVSAVEAALQHISAGDIYQVNLARCWEAPIRGDAFALWLAMREASPVPFGFFLDADDHQVLARTMECFLRWQRDRRELETRPIKGTAPRNGADHAEAQALRADGKENAEHSMIVDLMRNDLSRVAEVGSVQVQAPMTVEPFRGLHHMVSTVRCTTREDVTPADILRATFPPGSVTGTPKVRAVEIIEELERLPRGVYTGCVGYFDGHGFSLAVAIRTATITSGKARYFAGGGLVEASNAEREVDETDLKARAFLDAVNSLKRTQSESQPRR